MLYYRNSMITLKEVWGPETIAASAHANEAFTSVRNCTDSKPRKPSDSSTGLGASEFEVESKKLSELPAPKPTAALVGKEKQVCMYKIWGEDSPFPVTSSSGTPIVEVWAATLGKINSSNKQSFALRGSLWDCGSQIECPGGFCVEPGLCSPGYSSYVGAASAVSAGAQLRCWFCPCSTVLQRHCSYPVIRDSAP